MLGEEMSQMLVIIFPYPIVRNINMKKECSCKFTYCNVTTGICFCLWSDGNNSTRPLNWTEIAFEK
jgi:hypothetical protein